MAIDENAAMKYLDAIGKIEKSLEQNQNELFSFDSLREFKGWSTQLRRSVEESQDDKRTLKIGIMGAVKAGKSSFLNACLFKGEEYLPKAATPMTAALTKISYSDSPKAFIHFYTLEDWGDIKKMAEDYDKDLKAAYEAQCETRKKKSLKLTNGRGKKDTPQLSLEEFEKGYSGQSKEKKGAKELVGMAKDPAIMSKLGGEPDVISGGDVFEKLKDYIGAEGHYTPIVNYVELQVDNPAVKDLVIVDTPGLNDAVVSRSQKTLEFLRDCNVVMLLSPCSQFMDAGTVSLMAGKLPHDGVNDILVVGSKLDSGILDITDIHDFMKAWKSSLENYKNQFRDALATVRSSGENLDIIDKMDPEKVLFISSSSYVISRKLKEGIPLNAEEQVIYDNLHGFENFDDKYFATLGSIGKTHEALNNILAKKNELFNKKDAALVEKVKVNHLDLLERINGELYSRKKTLGETSAEELKQRRNNIQDAIDSSRIKIREHFKIAITKCEDKINQIKPELTIEMGHHQNIDVETSSHKEHYTASSGLFGWRKTPMSETVTEHTASISEVISNIKNYAAECTKFVNGEFHLLFNKEEFSHKIKEVVLNAFDQGEKDFDEDDILLPLQSVLNKISIPQISLDYNPYIDELSARFRKDYAQDTEIHQLATLQSRLLNKIETDLNKQVKNNLDSITKTLTEQAATFADQIQKTFDDELKALEGQVKEKERYIKKYEQYIGEVRRMKEELQLM